MDENQLNDEKTCSQPQLAELLPLYINGNLSRDDLSRMEGHIAECGSCQDNVRFFLDLQSIDQKPAQTE